MELQYFAEFDLDSPIDQEFMDSSFPHVNAPAIAYPYLRSTVSTVCLNSGYNPVILPTINFQAMYKRSIEEQEDEKLESR
ncbi:hypothetical protein C2869_06965 [Saccharobesus litoralis]|uniref:Preprotein translocase subunit SecB n=2 Tax=Saccharobesus litoralis TaxID=2172099 RepID=A0A2S0VXQ8_9ALTE|nr:hypothetical protein C2869_06965 [Saccharobesus litoralis]